MPNYAYLPVTLPFSNAILYQLNLSKRYLFYFDIRTMLVVKTDVFDFSIQFKSIRKKQYFSEKSSIHEISTDLFATVRNVPIAYDKLPTYAKKVT